VPELGVATPQLARLGAAESRRVRAAIATVAITMIVAGGIAIAVGAAFPHSALIRSHAHPHPSWMAGPLAALGAHVTFEQFLLLEGVMAVGYVALLAARVELAPGVVLAAVAVLHVAFFLAPPLLSTDVFSYLDYARLGALHGIDPYLHGPSAARGDAAFALTAWRHTGSAYGPLFTLATYPLAWLSLPLAVWGLKLMACLASLGCVALVWRIAGQLGRSPLRAVAVFGLNPLLLVWTVGGAHNDVLMLALALAAVTFVLGSRERLGGAAIVAAAAVKATAGLALPFLLLARRRRSLRVVAGAAVAGGLVLVAAAVAFPGHPLGVVTVLRGNERLVAFDGIPNALAQLVGLPGVTGPIRFGAMVVFGVTMIALAVLVWRGYDWVSACGWAFVAVVAASPWFLAWYTIWPLPFAALSRDRRLLGATVLLQLYFAANHIPQFILVAHHH
jgi:alpha-1,6-mannosyltransferase